MVKFPTRFDELLPPAAVSRVLDLLSQPNLSSTVREALNKVGLKDANPVGQIQEAWRQARGWVESVAQQVLHQTEASPAVINATGRLFDARWSSLPCDSVVVQSMAAAAVSFQDQNLLEKYAERTAVESTGAQAAATACSISALCGAFLSSKCAAGGIVISRSDIVRLPGSIDLRHLLSGLTRVTEVGAVNGAGADEWKQALISDSQLVVLVSPNNLTSEEAGEQRTAALAAARSKGCKVVEILFDAVLDEQKSLFEVWIASGIEPYPVRIDLVLCPLDHLIGGPTGAVAVGRAEMVTAIRDKIHEQGLKLCGPSAAGAAVALGTKSDTSAASSVMRMLLTNEENLKDRARRIALQLNNSTYIETAEAVTSENRLGPSPWTQYRLIGHAVSLVPRGGDAAALQSLLASGKLGPAIWSNVENNRVMFELRWVDPADDHLIVSSLAETKPETEPDQADAKAEANT
ncbi:MAG: hypothetical protein U0892_12455 [Pirellulales bacterium]